MFNEYYRLDEQTLRLSTIERSIREYISTGRISRRPPFPMGEYLPPMYGLKDWRFLESQVYNLYKNIFYILFNNISN